MQVFLGCVVAKRQEQVVLPAQYLDQLYLGTISSRLNTSLVPQVPLTMCRVLSKHLKFVSLQREKENQREFPQNRAHFNLTF
jgi:hypothetical protein